MRPVDPVADVRLFSEHLKAVQQAWRYVQVPEVFVVQKEGLRTPKGGRRPSGIDHHVMNGAACTADELTFTLSGPAVQTANHSLPRARLRVLEERMGPETVFGCDLSIEGAGEQAAVVVVWYGDEDQNAGDSSPADVHQAMMPLLFDAEDER